MVEVDKVSFTTCVVKQTTHYYKKIGIAIALLMIIVAVAYAAITLSLATVPILWGVVVTLQWWVAVPVIIILAPILTAVVVCYLNRNDAEISKVDADFVCKEE